MTKRRAFTVEFTAQIVLDLLTGRTILAEIYHTHDLSSGGTTRVYTRAHPLCGRFFGLDDHLATVESHECVPR